MELDETEKELQRTIKEFRELSNKTTTSSFVIPVVMHVFHHGDDGKMDMDQALSGLEILNKDFNGLNNDWNSIDKKFDPIKGTLDITFCLASIDPDGNPTTGLIYHEDEDAMYNRGNLFQYAWDNHKYLNIYFPKYTRGTPSDHTAYTYYPSTANTNANRDGIFYSSIRWGYGNHSELADGDEWASVCTHEVGHWLNLRHTFENGCSEPGDFVDDTPPTLSSGIELEGCHTNDYSCNVLTNGENYMDYNHRCKKMFTLGQMERMTAALHLPSRANLWSKENLIQTGCIEFQSVDEEVSSNPEVLVYPNPASNLITFEVLDTPSRLRLYNGIGQHISDYLLESPASQVNLGGYAEGIYFFTTTSQTDIKPGKFIIKR